MAEREYFVDLNLGGNQIKNVKVEKLTSLPTVAAADEGRLAYYGGKMYIVNATGAWEMLTSSTGADGQEFTLAEKTKLSNYPEYTALQTEMETFIDETELSDAISALNIGDYLKSADAETTYLKQTAASSTYVAKETGKSLIADTEIERLAAIPSTVQENVIEEVQLDGVALAVNDKTVNVALAAKYDTISSVDTKLADKVDKVTGKQLSTEDYTSAEKTKLAGIETGAQVNVIESVTGDGVSTSGKTVTISLANYATKSDISSVYKPKGNATSATLPADAAVGDVYNLTDASAYGPAGTNVVKIESGWDALSGIVDLSAYAKTADVNASITNATSPLATKTELSTAQATLQEAIDQKVATTTYEAKVAEIEGNVAKKATAVATGEGVWTGKITVNAEGIVTAGAALTAADVPALTASKISDFDTAVASAVPIIRGKDTIASGLSTKTVAHGCSDIPVAQIRDADGKVVEAEIIIDATNITVNFSSATSEALTLNWIG